MNEKDNIISLEERLRRKQEADAEEGQEATDPEAEGAAADVGEALPAKLVWLHCPACNTVQYTEVVMAGGRTHNVCGNQVEEIELDIDLRAEYTIAAINLERLRMLSEAVAAQRERYQEYQDRLRLIAGREVPAYPVNKDTVQKLPVAEVDAMGLLISNALHEPARHFTPIPAEESPETAETPQAKPAETQAEPAGTEPEPARTQPEPAETQAEPEMTETKPSTDPDSHPPKS